MNDDVRMRSDTASDGTPLKIDVIVRTLAEKDRRQNLYHALDTMRAQRGVETTAIVVVNGDRFDAELVEELKQCDDVRFCYLPEPSLLEASRRGRALVAAPFFTFLDDDDEFIPDTLCYPAQWLAAHADYDAVVNNLYQADGTKTELASPDMDRQARDPLGTLMARCWLHPGGALFRTTTIDSETLYLRRSYMEWTNLAFKLVVIGKRLHFMDVATVIYNDTAGSMSKNPEHQENAVEVLGEIMTDPRTTATARRLAREKYANTLHVLAYLYWQRGDKRKAWNRHIRSLAQGSFFKYVFFSRKLVLPSARS